MTHWITARTLDDRQHQELVRRVGGGGSARADDLLLGTLGCAVGFFLAFLAISGLAWIAGTLGIETSGSPGFFWILALAPTAAGLAISTRIVRRRAAARNIERREIASGQVQLIHVENARVIEHEAHNDEGPIYYFGIGAGKVLCLRGPWMWDLDYGLPTDDPRRNDREPPFPTSSFTVHRLPAAGHVLQIEVAGPDLIPETILPFETQLPAWMSPVREDPFADSFLLDGDFDELLNLVRTSRSD